MKIETKSFHIVDELSIWKVEILAAIILVYSHPPLSQMKEFEG